MIGPTLRKRKCSGVLWLSWNLTALWFNVPLARGAMRCGWHSKKQNAISTTKVVPEQLLCPPHVCHKIGWDGWDQGRDPEKATGSDWSPANGVSCMVVGRSKKAAETRCSNCATQKQHHLTSFTILYRLYHIWTQPKSSWMLKGCVTEFHCQFNWNSCICCWPELTENLLELQVVTTLVQWIKLELRGGQRYHDRRPGEIRRAGSQL